MSRRRKRPLRKNGSSEGGIRRRHRNGQLNVDNNTRLQNTNYVQRRSHNQRRRETYMLPRRRNKETKRVKNPNTNIPKQSQRQSPSSTFNRQLQPSTTFQGNRKQNTSRIPNQQPRLRMRLTQLYHQCRQLRSLQQTS